MKFFVSCPLLNRPRRNRSSSWANRTSPAQYPRLRAVYPDPVRLSFDSLNVVSNLYDQIRREYSGMRVKHLCVLPQFSVAANRIRSKKRSRRLTREVCRVVRAAHAVVLRDCWIGTDWPCHVHMVVTNPRRNQSIGGDSGLAPTL